ncbi:MAG: endonuclease III domain-containing protein [Kiritimatiellaeota bacterium]|nr:endonuclease III domain-containing protein [Kiritimatiellota bacterium]
MKRSAQPPPLAAVFRTLLREFGPQHWWPGRTRLEVCVGAILTQNTAWTSVAHAIGNLRHARALNLATLHTAPLPQLAAWIRPAGYFNVKARRMRAFTSLVAERFGGKLGKLLALSAAELRATLLEVNGIGPETADCIVLYAARQPVFVVDTYTRRFLYRHSWVSPRATYDEVAALFTAALPRDEKLFNEYHALIVALGKNYCRTRPECAKCPLRRWL